MSEIDYQTALLLQHQFEQEHRKKKANKPNDEDLILAMKLQEQFEKESQIENPNNNLVYKKKNSKNHLNSSKSLVDPSWEVIDPTPDIRVLFVAFNEKFFWNELYAVTVSWSKRMTSCAGICSYEGRRGICKITLSEPLLKLRPRKDLVETLLHEMIHAFLFVTNNNKDRSGHGPEFHKHMYRINAATGTNITVYHDFHDEVRLYKTHVWRCDGPCQKWRPHFGTVRRATNRAPGPYDFWFGQHSRECGGTFIKVSEPEKTTKNSSKKEPTIALTPKNDIRKFFPGTITTPKPSTSGIKSNNIHTISNSNQNGPKISTVIPSKTSNIKGFTNLNGTVTLPPKTVTKTSDKNNSNNTPVKPKQIIKTFSGTGHTLSPKTSETCDNDYNNVRNHWINKFSNNNNGIKRPNSDNIVNKSAKVPKINNNDSIIELKDNNYVSCPVCNKPILVEKLNEHLDLCLTNNVEDKNEKVQTKKCPVCEKEQPLENYDVHAEKCLLNFYDSIDKQYSVENKENRTECLACGKQILKSELDSHLDDCMNLSNVFDMSNMPEEGEEVDDEITEVNPKYNCPICMKMIDEREMNSHIDLCLKNDPSFVEPIMEPILFDEF